MECSFNKESYELICKLANKFAYGAVYSIKYEEFLNAGIIGLEKAIKYYNDDKETTFKTIATTCIVSSMRTCKKKQNCFGLTQDENVVLENVDSLTTFVAEEDMEETAKKVIIKVNANNERDAEIFMRNIGLIGDIPMDYKELSIRFNMTDERIRQICVKTRKSINDDPTLKELLYSYVS